MSETIPPGQPLEDALTRLPFRVLVWVAGSVSDIEPEEVEVFLKMLARRRWCHSERMRELLPRTAEQYSALWGEYQAGEVRRELFSVQRTMEALHRELDKEAMGRVIHDLEYLAESIARASTGLLGLGTFRRESQRALNQLSLALDCQLVLAEEEAGPHEPPSPEDARRSLAEHAAAATASRAPLEARHLEQLPTWQGGRTGVVCQEIVNITHDVKTFRFAADPPVLFSYAPGQFVTLELDIDGQRVFRSYTISSPPSRPHVLEITAKRVDGGLVSNWLHDRIGTGDRLELRGPAGDFSYFNDPAEKLLLISAGSGITPVMSMARWLTDVGVKCDIVFLHIARTEADIIFRREIEMLGDRHAHFRPTVSLTRPRPSSEWRGPVGRLGRDLIRHAAPDVAERTVFCCGPEGFMSSTREMLLNLGLPAARYHEESFGSARASVRRAAAASARERARQIIDLMPVSAVRAEPSVLPTPPEGEAPRRRPVAAPAGDRVVFSRSEKELEAVEGLTLLELAESAGVDIPSACRAGVCGTCKVVKMEGDVEMESGEGLEPQEAQAGFVLTCVSYPKGRVVLGA